MASLKSREKKDPNKFSGKFMIRAPRSLHAALRKRAEMEGVSMNELVMCLLASKAAAKGR